MCPRLSPKKSWEGFVGGMAFCVIAAVAYSWITNTNVFAPMLMAVGVSVFATWGDLFESLLKRSASVKDSGNLIPGHGGILDRIDSLLFVVPVIAFYDVLYKLTISIFV
jgi:phosphatidate cytidylyltransferase